MRQSVVVLVTYLPFYRIHEISEYFVKNIEILKPKVAVVYVDNVFHEKQKEALAKVAPEGIEVRIGNWRSRCATWITMLRDFHSLGDEIVVVDSDNVFEEFFPEVHSLLKSRVSVYTILDEETYSLNTHLLRSLKLGELKLVNNVSKPLYAYRVYDGSLRSVFRGGSMFFIGPKQVVVLMKLPDIEIINKLNRAMQRVDPHLRNHISDETILGVIMYLMGFKEVLWTIASRHYHHGSEAPLNKALVASAHLQFAKALVREFGMKELRLYAFKYTLALAKNIHQLF